MREKIVLLPAARALEYAAKEAGVKTAEVRSVMIAVEPDGFFRITFHDEWMSYLCYVDYFSGEVQGFFSEPQNMYIGYPKCVPKYPG